MTDKNDTRRQVKGKYLRYLNRPMVREGNTICYGDKTEKCFLILEIMSYTTEPGKKEKIPDKIFIQVVDSADPTKIIKQGDKSGITAALNMGMIWLERANKQ